MLRHIIINLITGIYNMQDVERVIYSLVTFQNMVWST